MKNIVKNVVFDLGGVLFARDKSKSSQEFSDFFAFLREPQMPEFWEEYDRGTQTLDQAKEALCRIYGYSRAQCDAFIDHGIAMQSPVRPTEQLIEQLKAAGYRLYVLSNMSVEFIDFLRRFPVYRLFDGEVVSCEEHTVKPEPRIYEILLERYALDPSQTLFIDDRQANIAAADRFGIHTLHFDHQAPQVSCELLRQMLL